MLAESLGHMVGGSGFEIEMIFFFFLFFLGPVRQIFVTSSISIILGNDLLTGCIFHLLGSQNVELRP